MSYEDKVIQKYCERVGYTISEAKIFSEGGHRVRLVKSLFESTPKYFIEAEVVESRHGSNT